MKLASRVQGLTIERSDGAVIVDDVSWDLSAGETLGLVGESGSGKTTLGLALLGYTQPGLRRTSGHVEIAGVDIFGIPRKDLIRARGSLVSYVPQDPGAALNPSLRIGAQLANVYRSHRGTGDLDERITNVLATVQLPTGDWFKRRFPHELSGGQQQRVLLALALCCQPTVVVMDEPTTGLDVVIQARVIAEIQRLKQELQTTLVYVSHDLAVVATVADRVAVMYAGRVVETGPVERILRDPRHPYTRGLVSSIPDHRTPRDPVGIRGVVAPPAIGGHPGCGFVERCEQAVERCHVDVPELASVGTGHSVRCPEWRRTPTVSARPRNLTVLARNEPPLLHVAGLDAVHGTRTQSIVAANDVSFDITRGECLALVGESGSGKTTIARCLLGLHPPSAGDITLDGVALQRMARSRTREQRRRIQIVFQNPRDSLNPRRRILEQVMRPAILLRGLSKEAAREEAGTTLEKVQLSASLRTRLPHELSGGELQRVAIARALAADPDLIVCDEVTSSLDVSVQATVLNLLTELRVEFDLALLFITHDLGVVASIADRVMVLDHGRVCESGRVVDVFRAPRTAYARTLIDAAPSLFGAA